MFELSGGYKQLVVKRSMMSSAATLVAESKGVLDGLRVLEIGHYVAAPFCARLLGDLGADVIKVEPPTGDPVRQWGAQVDGQSIWWSMHGRNKRCITINLKSPEGRGLLLRLVAKCDVVIENFRPGQIDKWGLGPDVLRAVKPDLVIVHISGYGQSGPYRDRPAFGVIGEAMGGLRHLTDHPPGTSQLPPVRVGVSIGDSIAGLYAAFGAMAALWNRDRVGTDRVGLTVDVALTESILSMMEGMLPEYGALGRVKQPTGGRIATAAPSNLYPTADGHWILIAANSDPLFAKLSDLIGRPELKGEMDFIDNPSRVANADTLDQIIGDWTRRACLVDLLVALNGANIPCSKVYTAADCAEDPQYRHRGMVREVADPNLGAVLQAGIVPHIPELPGQVRWSGPTIGYHNQEILADLLELDNAQIESLREQRAI